MGKKYNERKKLYEKAKDESVEVPVVQTKPNKKLAKIELAITKKKLDISNFLTVQGLGQNARIKIVKLFKELSEIEKEFKKESE